MPETFKRYCPCCDFWVFLFLSGHLDKCRNRTISRPSYKPANSRQSGLLLILGGTNRPLDRRSTPSLVPIPSGTALVHHHASRDRPCDTIPRRILPLEAIVYTPDRQIGIVPSRSTSTTSTDRRRRGSDSRLQAKQEESAPLTPANSRNRHDRRGRV